MFVIVEVWNTDIVPAVKVYGPFDTEDDAGRAIEVTQWVRGASWRFIREVET